MTSLAEFVHLRLHSAYSLSEGAVRLKELGCLCRDGHMPAVAVTDSNNLFGAMEFSNAVSDDGIQPIIGIQLSVRVEGEKSKAATAVTGYGQDDSITQPLVFLVKNGTGYGNLLKLLSAAYLEIDDAHDPHVTLDHLDQFNDGLIVLSGGAEGPVGELLRNGRKTEATELMTRLTQIYKGRLYVELQRHGSDAEQETEESFLGYAYEMNLPLVATNEVFFPTRDMYEAHDALLCIAAGCHVSETGRRRLTPEHYFKSAHEMQTLFEDLPEAIQNTMVIARRCAFMVEGIDPLLPPFDCGEGRDEVDELRAQSVAGLDIRLKDHVFRDGMNEEEREETARPYRERLEFELQVIADMGFPGYFLIVWDFIHWARGRGIPVGPGRGSGAASVAAWSLTITDLDPLRWGLLFERFLNPERVSMPDFDIDFCQDGREEVIRYVQEKYGRDHVAQIITFGKLQARAVLRDVGRVLAMPYGYVDKICKMVPNNQANPATLSEAIASEEELRRLVREDADVGRLIKIALKLEGLNRHSSTHAAGIVIADRPLDELVPLYRDPRSDMPVTGFNMKCVEAAGLVKFDLLGLKTLTVLATAEKLVADRGDGTSVDVSKIPLDDEEVFAMMGRGETTGVFQLESAGMRDVLRNLKPDSFEDIIAVVALYRPGPMDNIPSYINRKHGREEVDYLYPTLEGILTETGGIIIYQEQVMQIAQVLAGYTLGGADLLRRAMGKKIKAEMDQQRAVFVRGACENGVPEKRADEIFDLVDKFAGYGFNKAHASSYALVAYQTAYMKAHYPVEFMAASMTLDLGNTDKLNVFRQELDRLGIKLLQPHINKSKAMFAVEKNPNGTSAIRYALGAIRNVGEAAMMSLVHEREDNGRFTDLSDFINRLNTSHINKRQIENLIQAGGLDCFGFNRRQLYTNVELIMRHATVAMSERTDDQMGLFGGEGAEVPPVELPNIADWSPMDRLRKEFDAIGFYLSAHPLDAYDSVLQRLHVRPVSDVLAAGKDGPVTMAGTVLGKKERLSAKGKRYAFVQMSDPSGVFEITVFSETLNQARDILEVGQSLYIKAAVQFEGETPHFTVQLMEPLDQRVKNTTATMRVIVGSIQPLSPLREVLLYGGKGKGKVEIVARIRGGGGTRPDEDVVIPLKERYIVSPQVLMAVRALEGVLDVQEVGVPIAT